MSYSELTVIENDDLTVEIASIGAELKRVYGLMTGIEYLWHGSPDYWARSATLLFPFVGRLNGGSYSYKGKRYSIPIHGFAKDCYFDVVENSGNKAVFILSSNEETRKMYPFDFKLSVKYELSGMHLIQSVNVLNTSSEPMPFKIGFHPGFNVPLEKGLSFSDYSIRFDYAKDSILRRGISSAGLDAGTDDVCTETKSNIMKLDHDIFVSDAIVLSKTGGRATIFSEKSEHGVSLIYNAPYCGIWQTYKDDTPFVAIEPWYNLPGMEGSDNILEEMDIEKLDVNEIGSYQIRFDFS